MGTSTETQFVSTKDAKDPESAVSYAINWWRDHEAGREAGPHWWADVAVPEMHSSSAAQYAMPEGYSEQSYAVPVCDDSDAITTTTKHTIEVDGSDYKLGSQFLENFAASTARELLGTNVISAKVLKAPKPPKPKAAATEGKALTQYFLTNGVRRIDKINHDTQAAARQAGIELMVANPSMHQVHIEAEVVRDTNSRALVTITREYPETIKLEIEVTRSTPKPKAELIGWLVAFNYHH